MIALGPWDIALMVSVTGLVGVMALLRDPRRKAYVMTFPVPFTIAALAVGRRIDASNVLALLLLFVYTLAVYLLHRRLRISLAPSIVLSAAGFVALGTLLQRADLTSDRAFWWSCAGVLTFALASLWGLPEREERGSARELPLRWKAPMVIAVVFLLVALKARLGGFMTLFPMVGVMASYENRHGLWANVRQIPVVMLTVLPLLVTSRLTSQEVGLPVSLSLGWVAFLAALTGLALVERTRRRSNGKVVASRPHRARHRLQPGDRRRRREGSRA